MNHLDPYGFMIPEIFPPDEIIPSPLNLVTSCACEFWFDGLDASTFTLNGAKVIQWDDKSGNARHVAQAVDANRPIWSAVTGRLTFSDVTDTDLHLVAFAAPLAQPNTVFIVYKTTIPAGANKRFLDGWTASSMMFAHTLNIFSIGGGVLLNDGATNGNDNIHVGEFNGVTSNYWINGALVAGPAAAGANAIDGITIGAQNGATNHGDGEIMEVCGYNCSITAAERNAVTAYLNAKWGVY